jgi:hypothetical protein
MAASVASGSPRGSPSGSSSAPKSNGTEVADCKRMPVCRGKTGRSIGWAEESVDLGDTTRKRSGTPSR